jgi:7-alpha-hydroxysteroid dehydrogenase
MSFSIAGKTAVVTGAANGVGRAIARHFADRGANVMFADMDEGRLKQEFGPSPDHANMRYFSCDLREKLSVANLLSASIDAFDRVDILVNASRQVVPSDPLDPDDQSLDHLLRQNLLTGYRLTQQFARRMIQQAEKDEEDEAAAGTIINISSIAARRVQPGLLAYSVSAAAIDQMTRALAVELAPHRIRVNGIAFGSVMSASLQGALKGHEDYREEIVDHTPLSRIAEASELAEVAQFLASDGSGFMTGQILTVDGGRTLVDPVSVPAH